MGQTCAAGFYPVFKDNMSAIGLTAQAGPGAASRMHQAQFASGVALIQPMHLFLMNHPELFDTSSRNRRMYSIHAQTGTGLK